MNASTRWTVRDLPHLNITGPWVRTSAYTVYILQIIMRSTDHIDRARSEYTVLANLGTRMIAEYTP